MKLSFVKMQGAGNDYIYIDGFRQNIQLSAETIAFLSDRRFGIGGDGVIIIRPSERADGFMDMYNLDGSAGKMCGNGVRCVGKYLWDQGYARRSDAVTVDTRSGIKTLHMQLGPDERAVGATVEMGEPVLNCADIPVAWPGDSLEVPLQIQTPDCSLDTVCTCVSMGNPHAVIFVDNPDSLNLPALGPLCERHPLFPDRVNTEFVQLVSRNELRMRVWERGSGETLACGTGACAVAVAAIRRGLCDRDTPILVHLRGGDLVIVWRSAGAVTMQGPATEVFRGEIQLPDA